jgi:large subunit ribosomal protein L24e
MVVKRSCSFCAGEIEPGTGMMFVKRDGSVFHFCSSSCRKQQLHLGRVGHRLKWTRAHLIKRQTEQSSAAGKTAKHRPAPGRLVPKSATPVPAPKAPSEPASVESPAPETSPAPGAPAAPARKPRAKKPKDPAAESS